MSPYAGLAHPAAGQAGELVLIGEVRALPSRIDGRAVRGMTADSADCGMIFGDLLRRRAGEVVDDTTGMHAEDGTPG